MAAALLYQLVLRVSSTVQYSTVQYCTVLYTTACSDLVAPLDMFKANCMPTFLVLAAGDIVAFVHGANGKRMKEVGE